MHIYCQRQICSPCTVCGFWRYRPKSYTGIRRGTLVRWCQMRVRSSEMRVFSFDRFIFRMTLPTSFAYRNLHGFAQFPGMGRGGNSLPKMPKIHFKQKCAKFIYFSAQNLLGRLTAVSGHSGVRSDTKTTAVSKTNSWLCLWALVL